MGLLDMIKFAMKFGVEQLQDTVSATLQILLYLTPLCFKIGLQGKLKGVGGAGRAQRPKYFNWYKRCMNKIIS